MLLPFTAANAPSPQAPLSKDLYDENNMSDEEMLQGIADFASARIALLDIGTRNPYRLGGNDNVLRRIGEFWATRFLESIGQKPRITGRSNNPGFDLVDA